MEKDIKYYLALPYKTTIIPDPYGGFFARVEELSGCATQGETEEEALKNIQEAKELWLETAIRRGINIPEPDLEEYSGKFVLRIPKSLHREIAKEAKKENISINQYLLYLISSNHILNQFKNQIEKREGELVYAISDLLGIAMKQNEGKSSMWETNQAFIDKNDWEDIDIGKIPNFGGVVN